MNRSEVSESIVILRDNFPFILNLINKKVKRMDLDFSSLNLDNYDRLSKKMLEREFQPFRIMLGTGFLIGSKNNEETLNMFNNKIYPLIEKKIKDHIRGELMNIAASKLDLDDVSTVIEHNILSSKEFLSCLEEQK